MARQRLDGWVPITVEWPDGKPVVEWCHLGARRFTEPFFEDTIREALRRPFNRLFHRRTPIEALADWREASPGLEPTGFVFHMSRCGSTLLAQMLARLCSNVVLSEPGPVDSVIRA